LYYSGLVWIIFILGMSVAPNAFAKEFNIPGGDLASALDDYIHQSGISVVVSGDVLKGTHTAGVKGNFSDDDALTRLLSGTGFKASKDTSGFVGITRIQSSSSVIREPVDIAQTSGAHAALETVTVTSSKIGGDIQNIPISITALSQEQLT